MDPFLMDGDGTFPYSASLYPLQSEKNLLLVEEKIDKDSRYKQFLLNELFEINSNTLVGLVKKIMTRLFHDELLLGYDILGNRKSSTGKKDFLDLNICGLIFTAIVKNSKYEECCDDIERKIKAHLSQTSYRLYKQPRLNTNGNSASGLQHTLTKTSTNTDYRRTLNNTAHLPSPTIGTSRELGLDVLSKLTDLSNEELEAKRQANCVFQDTVIRNKSVMDYCFKIKQKKFDDAFDSLPLGCDSDVLKMEEMLKDSKFRHLMENKLQQLCCPGKLNDTIALILRTLFDDDCATNYYNCDVKNNFEKKFDELTIYRIIVDVVLKLHEDGTEQDIKTQIITWFSLASSRMSNK